jgi:hypothetical protein
MTRAGYKPSARSRRPGSMHHGMHRRGPEKSAGGPETTGEVQDFKGIAPRPPGEEPDPLDEWRERCVARLSKTGEKIPGKFVFDRPPMKVEALPTECLDLNPER